MNSDFSKKREARAEKTKACRERSNVYKQMMVKEISTASSREASMLQKFKNLTKPKLETK